MLQSLFVFDIAAMVAMIVLANLSKRLGDALNTPPWYRLLYATTACVFAAFALDTFRESLHSEVLTLIAVGLRALAGVLALYALLQYWKWLFAEFFHPKR
jgi:hypothetical protein